MVSFLYYYLHLIIMDLSILEEAGLTTGEAKVYLSLLKLGLTTTGPLTSDSGVTTSKVYKILDRLTKKGLASRVTKGKTMHFKAASPKRIIDYMEEKEKELDKKKKQVETILPQLESVGDIQKKGGTMFEGTKSIMNFFNGILDDLNRGDTYYVMGASYGSELKGIRSFFENFHSRRKEAGVKVKMLANHEVNLEPATLLDAKIRYLPKYFVQSMTIVFYNNKAFLFFLTKEPMGFLIENEEAVHGFKIYFDNLWKTAKHLEDILKKKY